MGGKNTTSVEIPQWLEDAARSNLSRADQVSQIGYVPNYGPQVAAFSPMQQASFQNTGDLASAFGMASPTSMGIPEPQQFAGGFQGYSAAPIIEQAIGQLEQQRPGQYQAISGMFIDPFTGLDNGNYLANAGVETTAAAPIAEDQGESPEEAAKRKERREKKKKKEKRKARHQANIDAGRIKPWKDTKLGSILGGGD